MPYSQATVSVTSATAPVSLIAPGDKTAWWVRTRTGAAVSVLIFFYTGALPGSAPAGVYEVPAGNVVTDADPMDSYQLDAFGSGIAAVLASGTTAVTVDAFWRS